MSTKDKTVFITGAAGDIGFGIGQAFAKQGAKVVICDLDAKKIALAVSSLRDQKLDAFGIECDVTDEKQIKAALYETHKRHGRIDILINNAGLQYVSPIEEFPLDKFELLIKVMLVAPFVAIKHVFPIMKQQGFGRIINMASINGLVGFAHKAAYNSAKHGVIGLTKVAALECAGFNITVNALCPGYVDTTLVRNQLSDLGKVRNISIDRVLDEIVYPLVPQKRLLTIDEIVGYVLFLASDEASGVTGQAVVVDGGYTAQ
jgi:3-hydroxybutyrate dehydrogenase